MNCGPVVVKFWNLRAPSQRKQRLLLSIQYSGPIDVVCRAYESCFSCKPEIIQTLHSEWVSDKGERQEGLRRTPKESNFSSHVVPCPCLNISHHRRCMLRQFCIWLLNPLRCSPIEPRMRTRSMIISLLAEFCGCFCIIDQIWLRYFYLLQVVGLVFSSLVAWFKKSKWRNINCSDNV